MDGQMSSARAARFAWMKAPTKLGLLALLALSTLVPSSITTSLVEERMSRQSEANTAIARSWGPQQRLGRLVLAMPTARSDGAPRYLSLSPDSVNARVDIHSEQRRRGFFATTVYGATIHLSGSFAVPETARIADQTVPFPKQGFLVLSLAGLDGVESSDKGVIGGTGSSWQPFEETVSGCGRPAGTLAIPVNLTKPGEPLPFEADFHLRGTGSFGIARLAKEMNVSIKGNWPSPSFIGDVPTTRARVASDGFGSEWHLDSLGTSRPWVSGCATTAMPLTSAFGVDFVEPVSVYRMVTRAAKYSLLFVTFAFTAYLLFELVGGLTITLLQYALMAASLSLFTLLLVSIGEVAGYTTGYVIASALVVLQASVYTVSVTRRIMPAVAFAAILSALFVFLYVLLGIEIYALLVGAVALFIALSLLMAATQAVYRRLEKDRMSKMVDAIATSARAGREEGPLRLSCGG